MSFYCKRKQTKNYLLSIKTFRPALILQRITVRPGQIQCAARAIEAWNREMNRYYKLLMGLLSPDEKTKLKKAQVAWLGFRDHEMTFQGTTYNNLEGSMWRVAAVYRQLEIVKQRATDLAEYYNVFSENKGPATKNK